MLRKKWPFILLAFLFLNSQVYGQACCGLSGSQLSSGTPAVRQGTFVFLSGVDFSTTQKNDVVREGIPIGIAYGVTNWLNISLKTGFAFIQSSLLRPGKFDTNFTASGPLVETLLPDTTFLFSNYGFGDGNAGVQFIIVPLTAFTKQEIKTGFDVGLPWASSREEGLLDGVVQELPLKAQNGGGGFTLGGFASYTKTIPSRKIAFTSNLGGRLKFQNNRGDIPGNDASILVSAIVGPFGEFSGLLSANYRFTGQTQTVNGNSGFIMDTLSGGNRIDILPGIDFTLNDVFKLILDVQLPLWRDANQEAIGTRFAAKLSLLAYIPVF
jgi:hypothetical protein